MERIRSSVRGVESRRSHHVDDIASATVHALQIERGLYNVVDDEPVEARIWLPAMASIVGAPAPRSVSTNAMRRMAGHALAEWASGGRGVDNARIRRSGWSSGLVHRGERDSTGKACDDDLIRRTGDLPVWSQPRGWLRAMLRS